MTYLKLILGVAAGLYLLRGVIDEEVPPLLIALICILLIAAMV